MQDRTLTQLSEIELLDELAECISLEGEAKARAEPIRRELLLRQVSTGETTVESNGWQSTLKKEAISASWVERQFGYPKEDIPGECYDEVFKPVLNAEKVYQWLVEKGHDVGPSYSLTIGRKKPKTLINRK